MAEIDNWIKEQLKKGYKKELIKEGLRKAGYQQNTIDSVDSIAKKRKLCLGITVLVIAVVIIALVFMLLKERTQKDQNELIIDKIRVQLADENVLADYCNNFDCTDKEKLIKEKYETANILMFYTDIYRFRNKNKEELEFWYNYAVNSLSEKCSDVSDVSLAKALSYSLLYTTEIVKISPQFLSDYLSVCENVELEDGSQSCDDCDDDELERAPLFSLAEAYYYLFEYTKNEDYKKKFSDILERESENKLAWLFEPEEFKLRSFECEYECNKTRFVYLRSYLKEEKCNNVMKTCISYNSSCLTKDDTNFFNFMINKIEPISESKYAEFNFYDEISATTKFLIDNGYINYENGKVKTIFMDKFIEDGAYLSKLGRVLIRIEMWEDGK